MRPRITALVLACGITAAGAQGAGEIQDLTFPVRDHLFRNQILALAFPIRDLLFRVEDLAASAQSLQVKETATETRLELPADVLFDFDKADIRSTAAPALKRAADILRQRAKDTVLIEGHTDAKGTSAYNKVLSERRAASVRQWLVDREGLRNTNFATRGLGAEKPIAPNARPDGSDDPEGRQKNRRVEIVFGKR